MWKPEETSGAWSLVQGKVTVIHGPDLWGGDAFLGILRDVWGGKDMLKNGFPAASWHRC